MLSNMTRNDAKARLIQSQLRIHPEIDHVTQNLIKICIKGKILVKK